MNENTLIINTQIEQALEAIKAAQQEGNILALPGELNIHDLEKYHPERHRFRADIRSTSLADFCRYANEAGSEASILAIDKQEFRANLIVDAGCTGTALHAEHRAFIELKRTSPFDEYLAETSVKHTQKSLAEFAEDYRDYLRFLSEDQTEIPLATAIQTIRSIHVSAKADRSSEVSQFKHTESASASTEAASKTGNQIPGFIQFKTEPFMDFEQRTFNARISLHTDDEIKLSLKRIRHEIAMEKVATEFEDKIRTAVTTQGIRIISGQLKI